MRQEVVFWANEKHVKTIRDLLKLLPRGLRVPEQFHRHITTGPYAVPSGEVPGTGALRNFVTKGTRLRTPRHLTRLLQEGMRVVEQSDDEALKQQPVCIEAARLLSELTAKLPADETGQADNRALANAIARGSRIALEALHCKEINQRALNEKLFANCKVDEVTRRRQRQYWCYRYHSHPGWVVKSLLVLKEPARDRLFAEFECEFTHGRGARRRTSGWVLAMGRAAYLFGQIGDGAGLKVIVVPNLDTEQETHPGLILAMDEDATPIAGRCVLVPTDAVSKNGEGRILDERNSDDEGLRYRPQFRNRVKFTLDSELLVDDVDGKKPIAQRAMVDLVGRMLEGRFTYKNGDAFNPADTIHYTFNVALRKYDAANDEN